MENSLRRIVVVSTNNNPDYYHYAKYIERAWNALGWDLCVMITHDVDPLNLELNNKNTIIVKLPEIPGLRIETVAQASRLYAANFLSLDALIMTSDMDLLPLMDYWNPSAGEITVYGHDLTDFSYYPMGYIAMTGHKWREVMNLNYNTPENMLRDANETKIALSDKWEEWWNFDWDLITKRLQPFKNQIKFLNRGRRKDAGFAFGRIDRGDSMKIIEKPWVDAHCENSNVRHPDKLSRFLEIFEEAYGKL